MNFMNPLAGGAQSPSTLVVNGEGRVDVAPDSATVSLGATARAPQAAAAFQQVSAVLNRVIGALVAAGVPREQIQTSQIQVQPAFEDGRPAGFEATATVRVTLRDLSTVGRVIDAAVAAGANNVAGVSFELQNPATAEAAALARAVQDAQRQAMVLARSLGVALGPVLRVEAEPTSGPPVPIFARAEVAQGVPVLPGLIAVTRRVRVEYMIGR